MNIKDLTEFEAELEADIAALNRVKKLLEVRRALNKEITEMSSEAPLGAQVPIVATPNGDTDCVTLKYVGEIQPSPIPATEPETSPPARDYDDAFVEASSQGYFPIEPTPQKARSKVRVKAELRNHADGLSPELSCTIEKPEMATLITQTIKDSPRTSIQVADIVQPFLPGPVGETRSKISTWISQQIGKKFRREDGTGHLYLIEAPPKP